MGKGRAKSRERGDPSGEAKSDRPRRLWAGA